MKWFAVTSLLLLSFGAEAGTVSQLAPKPPQNTTKINIINGKKFFSLENAKRFNGSTNTPKAQSIMHHPLQQPATPVQRNPYLPGPPAAGTGKSTLSKSASDQVLSVFAPDDKRIPPVPLR